VSVAAWKPMKALPALIQSRKPAKSGSGRSPVVLTNITPSNSRSVSGAKARANWAVTFSFQPGSSRLPSGIRR